MANPSTIHERPVDLLQALLRFDTTNPPGNEAACITYIADLLESVGIDTQLYEKVPGRPNLLARIAGRGDAAPLLLYGHVDVVPTAGQHWAQPPFAGKIVDDFVWGRGALDMKGGVAMLLAAFMRAHVEGASLPGDVILCLLSDEETGSQAGARFLVGEHPALFEGVRYALGEFGGFTFYIGGKCFYPIMVAEKQTCWLQATLRGPGGHGSTPLRGGSMAQLAHVLHTLDRKRLPVHITPSARQMFGTVADALGFPAGTLIRQLLNPRLTDHVLDLLGERGQVFNPLLHNTVSATAVSGGGAHNVIPSEITLKLDGRVLPGYNADDLLRELQALVGRDLELELVRYDPAPLINDLGLFEMLGGILREADPDAIPLPYMLNAATDGCHFAHLGIQTYGFLPMQLPAEMNFAQLIHAADERIPVAALAFGTDAIHKALQRFS